MNTALYQFTVLLSIVTSALLFMALVIIAFALAYQKSKPSRARTSRE